MEARVLDLHAAVHHHVHAELLGQAGGVLVPDAQLQPDGPRAGGVGLNLTAADVVIHYDPWWNLAAQNQATDRAHRIGQERAVTVFKLICADTIEERIIAMQESKRELAESLLSGEDVSRTTLTREDLLALLEG